MSDNKSLHPRLEKLKHLLSSLPKNWLMKLELRDNANLYAIEVDPGLTQFAYYPAPNTPEDHLFLEALIDCLARQKPELVSVREIEAFLKVKNSDNVFSESSRNHFEQFLIAFKRLIPSFSGGSSFIPPTKNFEQMKLVEKIEQLKAYFSSKEAQKILKNEVAVDLLDIENEQIYVRLGGKKERFSAVLEGLQWEICQFFQDSRLNLIPEE